MSSSDAGEIYNKTYYRQGLGIPYQRNSIWLELFYGIAKRLVQEIRPATVLDAGCAMGFLVEGLREQGVEAYGIDVSDYAIQQVRADLRPFCRQGSIIEPFPRRYDLVVSIEVLEHLSPAEADKAILNLCSATEDIVFSSTPLDYREPTHLNVQPPEYWAERFALQDFVRDVDFDASFITPWAVRFRRRHEPWHRVVRDYERQRWSLQNENRELRTAASELRAQLALRQFPGGIKLRLNRLKPVLAPPGSLRERMLLGSRRLLRRRRS